MTVAVILLLVSAPVPKGADADYFPTKVGDKWVYTQKSKSEGEGAEIVEVVLSVKEKDGVKTVRIGHPDETGKLRFDRLQEVSEQGVFITSIPPFGPLPAPRFKLKLPHKDGQMWDQDDVKQTLLAHGPEEVKVPAGNYSAIRVEHRNKGDSKSAPSRTYWYAPRVGVVKVVQGDLVIEMKSFTPGKD
jgi:hypothetical protein